MFSKRRVNRDTVPAACRSNCSAVFIPLGRLLLSDYFTFRNLFPKRIWFDTENPIFYVFADSKDNFYRFLLDFTAVWRP